ncbi:hypothetical protein ATERTT37_004779 [Aspergillus terreus]
MQVGDASIKPHSHTVTSQPAVREIILILTAISCYNAVELLVLLSSTFRQRRGLYFWSLLLSNCLGVLPLALANASCLFVPNSTLFNGAIAPAMLLMITGQSLVLYSRLHLVLYDRCILCGVLLMIVASCLLLEIPATVVASAYIYSKNHSPSNTDRQAHFLGLYKVMGKIAATGVTLQEIIISSLYIRETIKLLCLNPSRSSYRIMRRLIAINALMILMDLTTVSLEYANLWYLKTTLMATFDSIKLKLEFAVLSKLVEVVQAHRQPMVVENALCPLETESCIPMATARSSISRDLQSVRPRDTHWP